MNTITIEATISRTTEFSNALGIQCYDCISNGKITRFATRIIGTEAEKWRNRLKEDYKIKIRGNIAEVKQSTCGSFIVIYNPEILDVFRLVPERFDEDLDNNGQEQQEVKI